MQGTSGAKADEMDSLSFHLWAKEIDATEGDLDTQADGRELISMCIQQAASVILCKSRGFHCYCT